MASSEQAQQLPRGGMWEKQIVYGGPRLRETFAASERFILWGISPGGDVELDPRRGDEAPRSIARTNLEVAREGVPDERFTVSTLSSAIADMVPNATPGDFPVIAFWHEIEPKEAGLNPATVLEAVEPYTPAS